MTKVESLFDALRPKHKVSDKRPQLRNLKSQVFCLPCWLFELLCVSGSAVKKKDDHVCIVVVCGYTEISFKYNSVELEKDNRIEIAGCFIPDCV